MKWEYKTIKFGTSGWFLGGKLDESEFNNTLNQFGREQWELINVFDTNTRQGETRDVVAVFKRPIN